MGLVAKGERDELCRPDGAEDDGERAHGPEPGRALAAEERGDVPRGHRALRCAPRASRTSRRKRWPRYQSTTNPPATRAQVPMRSPIDGSAIAARMRAPS